MSLKLSICFAAGVTLMSCKAIFAQQARPPASSHPQLAVIVDGSVTPNQIPDGLAYRHYLTAIATHASPSETEYARQAAQIAPLGLSSADQGALISALVTFRSQLDTIESSRENVVPGAAAAAQISGLETQVNNLVAATIQSIRQMLTPTAANTIDQYVKTHVKTHIKIYGGTH